LPLLPLFIKLVVLQCGRKRRPYGVRAGESRLQLEPAGNVCAGSATPKYPSASVCAVATTTGAAAIGTVIRGARSLRSTPTKTKIRSKEPLPAEARETRACIFSAKALPGFTANAEEFTNGGRPEQQGRTGGVVDELHRGSGAGIALDPAIETLREIPERPRSPDRCSGTNRNSCHRAPAYWPRCTR
jgi:hypothetical protein